MTQLQFAFMATPPAPSIWVRLMDRVLGGLAGIFIRVGAA